MVRMVHLLFLSAVPMLVSLVTIAASAEAASVVRFSVESRRVSAVISQAPLREVLRVLAGSIPMKTVVDADRADERVSVAFERKTIEQALREIVKSHYIIEYPRHRHAGRGAAPDGNAMLTLRVLGLGQAPGAKRMGGVSSGTGVSFRDQTDLRGIAHAATNAKRAAERIEALEMLAQRPAGGSERDRIARVFDAAFSDPDVDVRKAAMNAAIEHDIALSDQTWIDVAAADCDPGIRIQTLHEVMKRMSPAVSRAFLERARRDPDALVSRTAAGSLRDAIARLN